MNRGGKREGAGRKPRSTPKKAVTVRLEPKTYEKFTKLRKAYGRSEASQIEDLGKRARIPQDAPDDTRG